MASGKIWAGVLPAATDQDTGVTPAGKVRTVSVNAANLGATPGTLKVYVSTNAAPAAGDRIEPDIVIPAGGLYKLTGEIVGGGERVILHVDTANVTARITCFEEVA